MFKLQPKPTFSVPVFIPVPGQEKGEKVIVTYRHKTRDQLAEFYGALRDRETVDALDEIIEGWEGVDAPYSRENLDVMLNQYPASATAFFESFRIELQEGRRKN